MGMAVHYRDEGPATGLPMVLLHGTSSSLLTWEACVDPLKKDYRVIRLDLPGFGLTGPHPSRHYQISDYVEFLHNFLKAIDVDSCVLGGNSMGGWIAWNYALEYPKEIKKIILLDAGGYPEKKAKGSLGLELAKVPVFRQLLTVITPRRLIKKSLLDVYGDSSKITESLVDQYHDMILREGNRNALLDRLSDGMNSDTIRISQINIPALIIWGDHDNLFPVHHAWKFHRDLPKDTVVIIAGAGHVPMEEEPIKTGQAIRYFLSALP